MFDRDPNGRMYIIAIDDTVVIGDGVHRGRKGKVTRIKASKITVELLPTETLKPRQKKVVINVAPDWVHPV